MGFTYKRCDDAVEAGDVFFLAFNGGCEQGDSLGEALDVVCFLSGCVGEPIQGVDHSRNWLCC